MRVTTTLEKGRGEYYFANTWNSQIVGGQVESKMFSLLLNQRAPGN
jgi:hypothetical protein